MAPRGGGAKPESDPRRIKPLAGVRRETSPQQAPGASSPPREPTATPGGLFSRSQRVRRRRDFLRVQQAAQRVTTRSFLLLVARSPAPRDGRADGPLPAARLGLVVTRKIGCAVTRNRIKRVCREAFRLNAGWFPHGVDVVVIARGSAVGLTRGQVEAEWRSARAQLEARGREALAKPAERAHVPASPSPCPPIRGGKRGAPGGKPT